MTEINPLDYYIPPFRENGVYILDYNGNMVAVLTSNMNAPTRRTFCDVLNDKLDHTIDDAHYSDGKIYGRGVQLLVLRGWGHLTGKLGLSPDEAAKIQDAMGEWIVRKLKGE